MRVLYLGKPCENIEQTIASTDEMTRTDAAITTHDYDLVVSYGYRHILPPSALTVPSFNLHIGYLPYNRGADPVLWSAYDDVPSGVTIHLMDSGIDTGDIIAQAVVRRVPSDTLRTLYYRHAAAMESLFCEWWPFLRSGNFFAFPQVGESSYHRAAERPYYPLGWDTPISELAVY